MIRHAKWSVAIIIIITMQLLALIAQPISDSEYGSFNDTDDLSDDEASRISSPPLMPANPQVHSYLDTYSPAVQRAFVRDSDMSRYDSSVLLSIDSWVVVSGLTIDEQLKSIGLPDQVTQAPVLEGAFIWTFEDPAQALQSLNNSLNLVASFSVVKISFFMSLFLLCSNKIFSISFDV